MDETSAKNTEPKRKRKRRPRWQLRLLALGMGIGVAFVCAEVFVRAAFGTIEPRRHYEPGIYQDDPDLGWAMLPGYVGQWKEKLYSVPVVTDERGLRMEPGAFEAYRKAKQRVLVLGDSITFGQGVRGEETYAAQLEALLQERGHEAAVVNAGVMGYDTRQERIVLERLIEPAAPDVVVLGWYVNDVTVASRDIRDHVKIIDGHLVEDEASYRAWRRKIDHDYPWDKSAFLRWVNVQTRNWSWKRKTVPKRARQIREGKVVEENLQGCLKELDRIHAMCVERGIPLVVLLFPTLELISDESLPALLWDRVEAHCKEKELPTFNLRGPYAEAYSAKPQEGMFVPADRCHPSPKGHRIAAEQVVEAVSAALKQPTKKGRQ